MELKIQSKRRKQMEINSQDAINAANRESLEAIKATYQKVVKNMRHGPWIDCD